MIVAIDGDQLMLADDNFFNLHESNAIFCKPKELLAAALVAAFFISREDWPIIHWDTFEHHIKPEDVLKVIHPHSANYQDLIEAFGETITQTTIERNPEKREKFERERPPNPNASHIINNYNGLDENAIQKIIAGIMGELERIQEKRIRANERLYRQTRARGRASK